ncbi:hypothetical protein [Aeromonas salmonicida]|uniref:hypothetical protein n=1 Tax=Aeromonas salmonicida TaxID=645 RepID=UPI0012FAEDC8|nr:hypothetical protein [Aeromonas salmonicida]QOI95759.1 hypothetical protein G7042_10210 [Aeromonas salmonicida subsp. masoucida]QYH24281.1 hypothetical protein G9H43_09275 [Aeromonas salmonicida subsp. masoucida]QYH28647.1 hypothetical protein G9457_13990 [Aeromonas salmonicida subsp. masoucida]WCH42077.1 hypothetical protein ONZ57_14795 [Aeromonas salmonicida]WCH54158.1 hypothetical protein ONZ63_13475 [Aeromonas salmonicida]
MRRFNFMLNGSRLMMFPFYVCILVCVALLMVKFAMQGRCFLNRCSLNGTN